MGTIVVLDDTTQNLILFEMAMKPLGHEIIGVDNPYHIYDEIKRATPDLIILDMSLPSDDTGIDIGRRVRQEITQDTPMFAVTASTVFTEEMATEAGFNGFLMRPVSVKTWRDLITKWLPS